MASNQADQRDEYIGTFFKALTKLVELGTKILETHAKNEGLLPK